MHVQKLKEKNSKVDVTEFDLNEHNKSHYNVRRILVTCSCIVSYYSTAAGSPDNNSSKSM